MLNQQDSDIINLLRFPLIVGILFIHTIIIPFEDALNSGYLLLGNSEHLFSIILPTFCVPLFFIFSGYLFFANITRFTFKSYVKKLKGRIHSLLIPYLFWNIVVILCYLLINYTTGGYENPMTYSIVDFIDCFWAGFGGFPIAYQLWYVRDLMIMILLTPIFYLLIKYLKWGAIVVYLLAMIFKLGIPKIIPILYFGIGTYLGIANKSISSISKRLFYYCCFIAITSLLLLYCYGIKEIPLIQTLFVLSVSIVVIHCGNIYLARKSVLATKIMRLSDDSFFIYVYHGFPIAITCSTVVLIISKLFGSQYSLVSDIIFTISFFIIPFIIAFLGIIIHRFLKLRFPRFTKIISGGR